MDRLGTNLIAWDKKFKPKFFGGRGIRKANVNNIALQLKLLWRNLKDSDNIWVFMVTRKYLKNYSLWNNVSPMSASS